MHNILIVENELPTATKIEQAILSLGHVPIGPICQYEEVQALLATRAIGLAFINIAVAGGYQGIATALHTCRQFATPLIFLITEAEAFMLRQVRVAQPFGFLVKPFTEDSLQDALGLAMRQPLPTTPLPLASPPPTTELPTVFTKYVFVRKGGGYVKLFLSDILYLEALQNYVRLYTSTDSFVIDCTLKDIGRRLPNYFLKTHRSYIVNLEHVQAYKEECVLLGKDYVPVSRSCQEELKSRINLLK